jgi:dephospho-CoA kinase
MRYQPRWPSEFSALTQELRRLELSDRGSIEHIGSTSVPDLAAKDVIDIQIRVPVIDEPRMTTAFERHGYRRRPEPWNNLEPTRTGQIPKLVFAPPANARPCNVHVRTDGTTGARDALMFRDCLWQDKQLRDTWGRFKIALAESLSDADLVAYGQVKQHAWAVLMHAADLWAQQVDWEPEPLGNWLTN